jgi:putative serine protease PepD
MSSVDDEYATTAGSGVAAASASAANVGAVDQVDIGDDIVAIGFALGPSGQPTVTREIVPANDRSLERLSGLIQTDAPINRGNSGGARSSTRRVR